MNNSYSPYYNIEGNSYNSSYNNNQNFINYEKNYEKNYDGYDIDPNNELYDMAKRISQGINQGQDNYQDNYQNQDNYMDSQIYNTKQSIQPENKSNKQPYYNA